MSLEQARKDLKKQKDEEQLITALVALAAEIKKAEADWSRQHTAKYVRKRQYEGILRSALSNKASGIHTFHRIHTLGTAIKQVEKQLEPYNIPKKVISDLLIAGGYAPLESDVYSAISPTRTSFALFPSAEDRESLAIKQRSLKSSALALGGVIGGIGLFTMLALLIKSATVVKTAVTMMAVATTATSAFPPLAIAMLAAGGAALLVTGIIIAAIAIKHYRDQQRMALGAAAFMGMATGSPAAALYAYHGRGGR